ncbi:MAG TPA: MarR family transcriptional regulator [Intrasporangium sp.]|uniref:MarR family winged helix-turn-helix transcriptional regulator n=1 Tax=Intrasporangium sp. TaxID=1925024 RepID=UPI002D7980B0|nr:MarR family transcriptional regulator [Intrasporangium sp.]HET7399467.1 MarR family transcriptional regulator [Intrasporangium sp.]
MTEPTMLANDLLRSAARLSRWASRHASFDVPFAQARLLALLDELGPSRVSVLAAADNTSQPTMTTQVQRVQAAGWVRRTPDPDDSRATLVSLTPQGREALASVRLARGAVLQPALERLHGPAMDRVRIAVDVLDELLLLATANPSSPHRKDA